MKTKKLISLILFAVLSQVTYAQFYTDPASTKWKQLKTDQRKIIYPDYYEEKAKYLNNYFDIITPYITYNISDRIDKLDVILHPENTMSNGFVAPAPRKMELFTPPASFLYSPTWLKQLVAHEYRHHAQLSNLNIGSTRAIGYLLGDLSVGIVASYFVPQWYMEGDAVMLETQMAMNGRGDQPDFSIELRAMLNENVKINKRTYNKWLQGSFKDFTPSIYNFGYFMNIASYKYYGDDYWKDILNYTGKRAVYLFSNNTVSKKLYNTTSSEMLVRTMDDLRRFWHNESQKPNSSTLLEVPIHSYTKYTSAQYFNDDLIVAQKKNLNDLNEIVLYDKRTSKERHFKYTPNIYANHDKIIVKDSSIYWSEYKSSLFWGNRVTSVIKKADIYEKYGRYHLSRPKTIFKHPNAIFVTPIDNDRYAMVCYDIENNPSIKLFDEDFNELKSFDFDGIENSSKGLAYDNKTSKLYYTLLGSEGNTIGAININSGEREVVCGPTYIVFKNLSVEDGRLFFGSTESGKDEVHMIDLEDMTQYQITSSQYGSFAGIGGDIGGDSGKIALSTYTIDGYILAEQEFNIDTLRKVDSKLNQPNKRLVVPTKSWNLPKIDTLNITTEFIATEDVKIKKYNKTSHLLGAPYMWIAPTIQSSRVLTEDLQYNGIGVGAMAMFQNDLNTMIGTVGYEWLPTTETSLVSAKFKYQALPVHIAVITNYGGRKQEVYSINSEVVYDSEIDYNGTLKPYFNLGLDVSMPMNFSGGTNHRRLEPFVNSFLVNSKILDSSNSIISESSTKLRYGISYDSYRYLSRQDLAPQLGYSLMVSGMSNPTQKDFGQIVNFYAKGYLPGLFRQHSLGIAAAYQYQFTDKYNYVQKLMFPRGNQLLGATKQTFTTAVNYRFPIANPDLIIPGVVNIRRVYFDAFAEYAQCDYLSPRLDDEKNVHTLGGEMFIRFSALGHSLLDFTLGLSLYKPSQYNDLKFGYSFGISF